MSQKSDHKVSQKAPKLEPKTAKKGKTTKIAKTPFFQNPKNGFSVFSGRKLAQKMAPKAANCQKR